MTQQRDHSLGGPEPQNSIHWMPGPILLTPQKKFIDQKVKEQGITVSLFYFLN